MFDFIRYSSWLVCFKTRKGDRKYNFSKLEENIKYNFSKSSKHIYDNFFSFFTVQSFRKRTIRIHSGDIARTFFGTFCEK